MEFWKRLLNLRKAHDLTKRDISSSIGIPLPTYRDWEAGRLIRGESYTKLAEVFDATLDALLKDGPVETFQILDVLSSARASLEQALSA